MATEPAQCPVRKLSRPDDAAGPPLERLPIDGREEWLVRSPGLARQVLRAEGRVRQAGFGAESVDAPAESGGRGTGRRRMRPPILYLEGAAHREQRRGAARLFAPAVVDGYRPMMEELADTLVAPLDTGGALDVPAQAMRMAVRVAARVVGLTESSERGMSRRLDAFFVVGADGGRSPRQRLRQLSRATAVLRFYWLDVKPAIRARRRRPGDDVISQLLALGYTDPEVLTECVTYAAAGMVTTREFISVAAWHLLDDPGLLAQYRTGDVDGRRALLTEVLRLEPVVGRLQRRTTAPMSLDDGGRVVEVPAGALVGIDLRAANTDEALVGADPGCVRPGRTTEERGTSAAVLSFGDGHHRCPGGPLAVMEAEVFLSRLLGEVVDGELVADGPPRVTWSPITQGYELRGFTVRRPAAVATASTAATGAGTAVGSR